MRKSLIAACALVCASAFAATPPKDCKFTQVINDVQIISANNGDRQPATVDASFNSSDVLRTGPASRAELTTGDGAITRVGASTTFSLDAANRSLRLDQGSVLFDSPKGRSEVSIHTAAATAIVRDGTVIVVGTKNGGSKILALEGSANVRYAKDSHQRLRAGQMMVVLADGTPGPVSTFRLDEQAANSKLVSGFAEPLPSMRQINIQIAQQVHQLKTGEAEEISNTVPVINPIAEINGRAFPIAGITPARPIPPTGFPPPQLPGILPAPDPIPITPVLIPPINPPPPVQITTGVTITTIPNPVPITSVPWVPPTGGTQGPILITAPTIPIIPTIPVLGPPIGVVIVGPGGVMVPNNPPSGVTIGAITEAPGNIGTPFPPLPPPILTTAPPPPTPAAPPSPPIPTPRIGVVRTGVMIHVLPQ